MSSSFPLISARLFGVTRTPPLTPATGPASSSAAPNADTFVTASSAAAAALAVEPSLSREQAEALVTDAYRTYLRREPDPEGFAAWTDSVEGIGRLGASPSDLAEYLRQRFGASPEYQALTTVDRTFSEELGHDVSGTRGYWHEEAVRKMRDEGAPQADVEAWLRESFRQSPEYRHQHVNEVVNASFQELLGHGAGDSGYWHDEAHRMVDEGSSLDEIRAHLDASIRQSDEYALGHLSELVESKYREHLGREGDPDGVASWTAYAEQLKADGNDAAQIRAALDAGFIGSDEYRRLHAPQKNGNRDDFYLQQPNGWTCAPTSLSMALAQWGVKPASQDTVWQMVAQTGASAGVGLPGNASLLARVAQENGLQAEYSASRSAADVRAQLEQGRTVIVNGSITPGVGHFLYLSGLDEQGRFIVCDPYRPGITRWTDADLDHFTHVGSNPPGFAAIWR